MCTVLQYGCDSILTASIGPFRIAILLSKHACVRVPEKDIPEYLSSHPSAAINHFTHDKHLQSRTSCHQQIIQNIRCHSHKTPDRPYPRPHPRLKTHLPNDAPRSPDYAPSQPHDTSKNNARKPSDLLQQAPISSTAPS